MVTNPLNTRGWEIKVKLPLGYQYAASYAGIRNAQADDIQRSMTIEEISSENGTLGKQLIAVLLEDRVMNQATAAAAAASGPEANIKMER